MQRRTVVFLFGFAALAGLLWAVFPRDRGQCLVSADAAAHPRSVARVGRRIVAGYKRFADVEALVRRNALAGIFITTRNVQGRPEAEIAADIARLQEIRKENGLPPLIVATDQEGGIVSHLSPPLADQPSLAATIAPLRSKEEQERAVRDFAALQARGLKRLGVTMNLAPVVDLRAPVATTEKPNGSRIDLRAIDSDPTVVADVAQWYCDELRRYDVACTLKHFPGLGSVDVDTHAEQGWLREPPSVLEARDWLPYRRLADREGVVMMIGHVRLAAVDPEALASFSRVVVTDLLRSRWGVQSVLISDDLGMGAVTQLSEGIAGAAVKALNAGIDLILIANCSKHFDQALTALVRAEREGRIDEAVHEASVARLSRFVAGR